MENEFLYQMCGLALLLIAELWLIISAFTVGLWWGLSVVLFPPVFVYFHWKKALWPLLFYLLAIGISFGQQLYLFFFIICIIQLLAALPWLSLLDPLLFRQRIRESVSAGIGLLFIAGVALALTIIFNGSLEEGYLDTWGRIFASVLQLQVSVDIILLIVWALLKLWPKGGAVALAAFREGVRQPLFWVLLLGCMLLFGISWVIPYFTFGEDLKMMKDLGFITILFAAAVFAVLTASISISEEIEGRTAITVMSKPISRRQFLLGKFVGIFISAVLLSLLIGWAMIWSVHWKDQWEFRVEEVPDPQWVTSWVAYLYGSGTAAGLFRGVLMWVDELGMTAVGIVVSDCQVMILLAVAVSLATRLPMIVNALLCLSVYFLGHLTTVLSAVTKGKFALIEFVAGVFNTVLPQLDYFDMGPAVVRDAPLPVLGFAVYTAEVSFYALLYTAAVLFFGLALFEDRDLA